MSSSVNYNDLYEEFLNLTSSPTNPNCEDSESEPLQYTQSLTTKASKASPTDNSQLRALLTPPSPISTSYSFPATAFLSLRLITDIEHEGGTRSSDFKMSDSNETSTASNTAASTSGSGRHMPTDTDNSSQNNSQSTYFQNLNPQSGVSSSGAGMQGGLQHNLTSIQNHSVIMDAHQQHQVPIHHHLSPYANQHLQHQLMEGHHHQQAHHINLHQQQNNAHQFSSQFPLPSSHIAHPNVHTNQQNLVPFGMNFNSNVVGNGHQYINNQGGTFALNNHHQLANQQHAHTHQMQQQHTSCFMQHSCMHMQHQPLAALNAPRSPNTVNWMSHQTSVPISGSVGNTYSVMSPGMGSTKVAIPTIHHPALSDPASLPGGLEHLWKNVPVECQRIMTTQDIPDSARSRGYFTVFELLQLKRSLMMRLGCGGVPAPIALKAAAAPLKSTTITKKDKEEGKRASKRGNNQSNNSNETVSGTKPPEEEGYGNGQRYETKEKRQRQPSRHSETNSEETVDADANMEQDVEDPESTYGEQMIAIANIKNEEIVIHTNMPPITGVGVAGAVKDAMNALTSDGNNVSADGDETGVQNDNEEELNAQEQIENAESSHVMDNVESAESNGLSRIPHSQPEAGITGEELPVAMPHTLPPISGILPKKQTQQAPADDSTEPTKDTLAAAPGDENNEVVEEEKERQKQIQLALVPISSSTTTAAPPFTGSSPIIINTSDNPGLFSTPLEFRPQGPSPPFRTSTLVLKLLQIGGYTIRSFSSINPNRIRVLFNNNRMTYECQLPIIRNPNPGSHLMRKILTVDIGFEQISVIKFGTDTLYMRVEGAPLLTLSYSPALEEPPIQALTPLDQTLLEQIERGQLKLSPCHQLYFLNERLVQQLESQFREHPRFRHLLFDDRNSQEASAQKRLKLS
ncbi:unnamed protein product [Orchesella dallaii]|uniref:Uncharacterized protein n=1 Tax=Orchesella dallaii TaxID=48710 RepID=A0ABP1Q0A2_9HEXA